MRGLQVFNGGDIANCSACHYAGANFNGNQGLMTDFTYQAIGAPRNDSSIPGNPDPIPANDADPTYFDMGLCGPLRTDHTPAQLGTPDPYCAKFKVPTLRNAATRSVFFHNGVFHSLNQVVHFYNTRDTNPEFWYPSTGGSGTPVATPELGAAAERRAGRDGRQVQRHPAGRSKATSTRKCRWAPAPRRRTTSTRPRSATACCRALPGSTPSMTEQQIADLICFLGTLSDGYQPPATRADQRRLRELMPMTTIRRRACAALLLLALLAACQDKQAQLPTRANFTAAVDRLPRAARPPVRGQVRLADRRDRRRPPGAQPRRAADAGARDAGPGDEPRRERDAPGRRRRAATLPAREYALTPEGQKYYLHVPVVVATATRARHASGRLLRRQAVAGPRVRLGEAADDQRPHRELGAVLVPRRRSRAVDAPRRTRAARSRWPMRAIDNAGTLQLRLGVHLTPRAGSPTSSSDSLGPSHIDLARHAARILS